ncbi:hypothetical protein [Spiroplasma endosymbiont of Aspidapion aeneum]|uniref:hypothetical protein n=1 Tax=Spiroplasma endosymbiont of Aspidapion aeneum TaxID=3066276 RepID=UPI00313CE010
MSLSATEMLRDCKKRYQICSNEIYILKNRINDLINQFSSFKIDTVIMDLLIKAQNNLNIEQEKIDNFIITNPQCEEVENEIERYNNLNNITERVNKKLNDIRMELLEFEDFVIDKEKENIFLALSNNNNNTIEFYLEEIKKQFADIDDKVLVKKIFDEKKHIYINMSKEEVYLDICKQIKFENLKSKFEINDYLKIFDPRTKNDYWITKRIKATAVSQNLSTIKAIEYSIALRENMQMQHENAKKVMNAIKKIGYNINKDEIVLNEKENTIYIHCVNNYDKTVDFSIKMDGSLIYNFEGFEGHEHDIDFNLFKEELRKQGIVGNEIVSRIYREPKYIKNKNNLKTKKNYKQ